MTNPNEFLPSRARAAIEESLRSYVNNGGGDTSRRVDRASAFRAFVLGAELANGLDPKYAAAMSDLVDRMDLSTEENFLLHNAICHLMDPPDNSSI